MLIIRQRSLKVRAAEEFSEHRRIDSLMIDLLMIGGESAQQLYIIPQKRCGIGTAIVTNEDHPSLRAQNAHELLTAALAVEPMKRLAGTDEINALVWQNSRLGSTGEAYELRKWRQHAFGGLAHFFVWLDCEQ